MECHLVSALTSGLSVVFYCFDAVVDQAIGNSIPTEAELANCKKYKGNIKDLPDVRTLNTCPRYANFIQHRYRTMRAWVLVRGMGQE